MFQVACLEITFESHLISVSSMLHFAQPLSPFFDLSLVNSEEVQLLRSQVQESKSLFQAAEVERDRLLELVSLLQRR